MYEPDLNPAYMKGEGIFNETINRTHRNCCQRL